MQFVFLFIQLVVSVFVCCLSVLHFIWRFQMRQIDENDKENSYVVSWHHVILCIGIYCYVNTFDNIS